MQLHLASVRRMGRTGLEAHEPLERFRFCFSFALANAIRQSCFKEFIAHNRRKSRTSKRECILTLLNSPYLGSSEQRDIEQSHGDALILLRRRSLD